MKALLVACECSQEVCAAFRLLGCMAFSNDIEPCYGGHPEWHIIGDAREVVKGNAQFVLQNGERIDFFQNWTMLIAHPPCKMLTHSSAVALAKGLHTLEDVQQGAQFFMEMLNAPVEHIVVENPAPMKIAGLPRYNQIVQPYQFGERFSKRICLWLKNVPMLIPTIGYSDEHLSWLNHCAGNSRRRSKTFPKVAQVMAENWYYLLK